MNKEVSAEEYQQMIASGQLRTARPDYTKPLVWVVVIIAAIGIGFAGGMSYQKGKSTTPSTTATTSGFGSSSANGQGFGAMRRGGSFGSVTAVSDSSISVKNDRTGSTDTFKITSSTTVTNNGSSASISDIKVGDTVMIRTDTSDTSTATGITLNPSFGGAPASPDNSSDSTSTSTDTQST